MLAVLTVVTVALPVALGAAATTTAAAPPAATSSLVLENQSPWVTPADPVFTVTVAAGTGAGSASQLSLLFTLYGRLTSRSVLEQMIASGPGSAEVLDRSPALPVVGLTSADGGWQVPVTIATATSTSRPSPSLDLGCEPGYCSGVYPVEVTLERAGGAVVGRLTTFLTYVEAASAEPLSVAWVVPFAAPATGSASTRRAAAGALTQLAENLADHPTVPVTVAAEPKTVEAMAAQPGAGTRTVELLTGLSAQPTVHPFLAQPYVPVDANALAGAGLTGELTAQMIRGAAVFTIDHVTTAPGAVTWVDSGVVGTALGRALGPLGATRVVVPDSALAPATGGTPTAAQPFTLALGRGQSVTGAAADANLTAHFAAAGHDPVLAANQLLADLALVHYEAPGSSEAPRGLVAVPPVGWTPDSAFDVALLAGLNGNPNVRPVTLATFFSTVPAGANGWPATRQLAVSGTGPVLPAGLARSMADGRLRLSAFDGTVSGADPLLGRLDDELLSTEAASLRTSQQVAGVAAFERSLADQLSLVQLGTEHTITLTSRTATIPITILSSAPYTFRGTLTLSSDKLQFPQGASRRNVVIDHPTSAVRFVVVARTSGDLPLTVTFTSPSGTLVVFHTVLTVRSTATSVAGVVLTLAALAVLLGWWARTWRARRRKRPPGGAGEDDVDPVLADEGELSHRHSGLGGSPTV